MPGESQSRLDELEAAASSYFSLEKKRLEADYSFLDAISKKRGGTVGLQDANAEGASQILADSINDYLGRPVEP
jgi:hypothetical protein